MNKKTEHKLKRHKALTDVISSCAGQARQCCGGGRTGADQAAGDTGGRQRLPVAGPTRALEPHQAGGQ